MFASHHEQRTGLFDSSVWLEAASIMLLAGSLIWAVWLVFSDASWLHPEILGSASYVWIDPAHEGLAQKLRKVLDWGAFDPNVNRVRPLNDLFEVVDAIARPYLTRVVGPQPSFNVSTVVTLIAAPALLWAYLRRQVGSAAAFALAALFVSTTGFLSLTVAYLHPAKKLNLVLLCAALYFAARAQEKESLSRQLWLGATLFCSFFADELGLANYAIIAVMYWATIVRQRGLRLMFITLPAAFLLTSGVLIPVVYRLLSVSGPWSALGDAKKFAVFGYLVSAEFYQAAVAGLGRSVLSTVGIRTHTTITELIAVAAVLGLPTLNVILQRLSPREIGRDPFVLSAVALVLASGYATLLDWYPFPHEVSYLGSFNYYYHSSIVVSVVVWLGFGLACLAQASKPSKSYATIALAAATVVIVSNLAMFRPVNGLVQAIHYYPYSRDALFTGLGSEPYAPPATPDAIRMQFKADLDAVFAGRPNGFEPILTMVEGVPIMTPQHVSILPRIYYPQRR